MASLMTTVKSKTIRSAELDDAISETTVNHQLLHTRIFSRKTMIKINARDCFCLLATISIPHINTAHSHRICHGLKMNNHVKMNNRNF